MSKKTVTVQYLTDKTTIYDSYNEYNFTVSKEDAEWLMANGSPLKIEVKTIEGSGDFKDSIESRMVNIIDGDVVLVKETLFDKIDAETPQSVKDEVEKLVSEHHGDKSFIHQLKKRLTELSVQPDLIKWVLEISKAAYEAAILEKSANAVTDEYQFIFEVKKRLTELSGNDYILANLKQAIALYVMQMYKAGYLAAPKEKAIGYTEKDLKEAFQFYHFVPFPHNVSFSEWLKDYKENVLNQSEEKTEHDDWVRIHDGKPEIDEMYYVLFKDGSQDVAFYRELFGKGEFVANAMSITDMVIYYRKALPSPLKIKK